MSKKVMTEMVAVMAIGIAATAAHAADDPITNFFTGISIIAWAFGMLPTIIAIARGHTHKIALGFLNFIICLIGIIPFIGFIPAVLGWIGTFIWAAAGEADPMRRPLRRPPLPPGQAVRPPRPPPIQDAPAPPAQPAPTFAEVAEEKTCPQCAEKVKAAALVCRFCGHKFTPVLDSLEITPPPVPPPPPPSAREALAVAAAAWRRPSRPESDTVVRKPPDMTWMLLLIPIAIVVALIFAIMTA